MSDSTELANLFENILLLAGKIDGVWQEKGRTSSGSTPALIQRALEELQPLLATLMATEIVSTEDSTKLGDYGLRLLEELQQHAESVELRHETQTLMRLCLPFGLLMMHKGARLLTPEPVVNAIADLANTQTDPLVLETLFAKVTEIMDGFDEALRSSDMLDGYGTPWKILLLNRAIIATRSHQQALIDQAYADIVRYLPRQAKAFFEESAEQMRKVDYPQEVKDSVMLWYQRYVDKPTLH